MLKKPSRMSPGRRRFCAVTVPGIIGGSLAAGSANAAPKKKKSEIKLAISHIYYPNLTDEMLTFMKHLEVDGIEGWVQKGYESPDHILTFKKKVEDAGLTLFELGALDMYNAEEFHLALPGRDDKLKRYQEFIRNVGKAGIGFSIYAWTPGGVYRTGSVKVRGCPSTAFDSEEYLKRPHKYAREYSDNELWDNYIYFMKRMLPVAEDSGVKLALHPGDPPVTFNIPHIFRNNAAYKRAFEIANNSPYSAILFCLGTWGEMAGPDGKGEDIIAAVRQFGKEGRIMEVHFRNVSSPLPSFHETFQDNGYIDMYKVMKTFREVGFSGAMVPDHVPAFTDEKRLGPMGVSGTPYSIGFMRGLLKALDAEMG